MAKKQKVIMLGGGVSAAVVALKADKNDGVHTGTTTVENLVITKGVTIAPAPMAALAIDIKEQRNTKSLSTNSTLSFSATPSSGDTFGAILTETGGSEITVGIPECYSSNRGGLITDFVLPGNAVVELGFWHDGTRLNISGDPRTPAQERAALGLAAVAATGSAADITTGVLAVAWGGTGTATPGLVAGSNITVTGTWPNQTIASTGGGGGGGGTFSMDDGDATADPATIASFDDGDATTA